ncbi:hypothetical protein BCR42DRAFT_163161 [Absidia repens]|uniref:Transcription factor domain-containing protein n=1 Tax=Absidia repens TaxID=90262 RepID=A0A1X2ITQ7_9FUNG|nr:hypothetical protein BCR42DRAFT_163161 [Absidia repens]
MVEVDGNHELRDLTHYVEILEQELQNLQLQLDQQRQQNTLAQQLTTSKSTSSMDTLPIPKEWNLTIVNGHLRLETGINTLNDLLQYRRAQPTTTNHIRYLSPFSNVAPVHFRFQQETMLSKAVHLLTENGVFNGCFENLNDVSSSIYGNNSTPWAHQHRNRIDLNARNSPLSFNSCSHTSHHPSILPATLFESSAYCPEAMVDILVKQYFKCYNLPVPMLHEPTYYKTQYKKHDESSCHTYSRMRRSSSSTPISSQSMFSPSPSSSSSSSSSSASSGYASSTSSSSSMTNNFMSQHSPITLAICCFMSVSYCRHLPLTDYQKREYGEYYYLACREQIDELFDDPSPHKQLQVLISINLLFKFIGLTLKLKDGRRLATIGYLIALDLLKHAASPNTTFDHVERVLTSRHAILVTITFGLAEFFCVQRMEGIMPNKIQLDALPDEPEQSVSMLRLFQYLFDLVFHYDCIFMIQQVQRVFLGQVAQISLEAMVRFDNLCMEWWKKLPDEWRYHENPYDPSLISVIEECENEQALVVHSFLLTLTLGVHSILLHPQNMQEHISELIQKRAMVMNLNCCELLMTAADRLRFISKNCGYYCDYLLRVFDSLHSLLLFSRNYENGISVKLVMKHLNRCLEELDSAALPDHQQHTSSSMPRDQTTSQSGRDDIQLSFYANSPLPGNALVFDIVSSCAKNLGVDTP